MVKITLAELQEMQLRNAESMKRVEDVLGSSTPIRVPEKLAKKSVDEIVEALEKKNAPKSAMPIIEKTRENILSEPKKKGRPKKVDKT
jgi:MinD-like ATPase involved in chromosome partitioning or flagellar assembly